MFRLKDVRERLDHTPFTPFRICMTDGRTYDIFHPELCMLGRNTIYVGVPDPKLKRVVMRVDQCALVHIVRLEELNGNKRQTKSKRR